ncbi:MAG: protein-methionine-sulfoxide reductase catalytic subunit MsrP [Rhodospirillales bacterium]
MLIRSARTHDPKPSEITPKAAFEGRRRFLALAAASGAAAGLGSIAGAGAAQAAVLPKSGDLSGVVKTDYTVDAEQSEYDDVTGYNNFYEFGTGKSDPAKNAHTLRPRPWTVQIDGLCAKPGAYDFDDLMQPHRLEERIYRFRCVEAWSMVVPWTGVPLAAMLKRVEPLGSAKYVSFETLHDPKQMPGQKSRVLRWPYREGLRLDEAMHPLTLMTVGVYGEVLPNQNGAPMRLIVPWKYGFKSIKSIVRITFTDKEPATSWNIANAREYGFYSNVNPEVNHPRWTQASERVIGGGLFAPRKPTLPFNGYAEDVASLYEGMDLRAYF